MMTLNIIPNEQKKEIKKRYFLYILKNNLFIFIILISLYTIIFLVSYLFLEIKYSQVLIEKASIHNTHNDMGVKISDINFKVNKISEIQKNSPLWSNFFISLSNTFGDGIVINNINVDTNKLTLSGNAETRDDLIKLQSTLEESEVFSDVDFPLKNILSSKNINFDITAKINNYEFK